MYHSEAGLKKIFQIPFFLFFIVWFLIIATWAGCKVHAVCSCTKGFLLTLFILSGFVVTPLALLILWSIKILEFTDAILWFCIAESVVASGGSFCLGLKCEELKGTLCFIIKIFFEVLYTFVILALNGIALWIFFAKETTDKSKSPEKSRDLNQECILLAFFDWHDVWHFCSSFGLFMAALMVIHTSYETRATTGVSYEPQSVPV